MRAEGGQLKLLRLTERVRDVMVITKLVTVFDVFDEEPAALASYN
jgi:anti-sigma B factor antagonist